MLVPAFAILICTGVARPTLFFVKCKLFMSTDGTASAPSFLSMIMFHMSDDVEIIMSHDTLTSVVILANNGLGMSRSYP